MLWYQQEISIVLSRFGDNTNNEMHHTFLHLYFASKAGNLPTSVYLPISVHPGRNHKFSKAYI